MKLFLKIIVVAALAAGAFFGYRHFAKDAGPAKAVHYRTAPIARADIARTVEATGTIEPIKDVQVGAQVNGKIIKLFVDYNSVVTNGQVVALIDPQVYKAKYDSSLADLHGNEAAVLKCRANLEYSEKMLKRQSDLVKEDMIAVSDYDQAVKNRDSDSAALKAAVAAVEKSKAEVSQAKANLDYCTIVSPVDGIVIDRNIDEGQTLVSSFSASELFKIATSLSRIQVEASVPEADIGGVKPGQKVTFTVDSYSDLVFTGAVTQVRMASVTSSSVVTYPVIIQAENTGRKLYPGMTATISIMIESAPNAVCVSSAAFRYRPSGDERDASAPRKRGVRTLYVLSEGSKPESVEVKTGISDGSFTVLLDADSLEGKEAVVGIDRTAAGGSSGPTNPFMPKPGGFGRRPPRGP